MSPSCEKESRKYWVGKKLLNDRNWKSLEALAMGLEHFLPPKIGSNFNSSDKITNFFTTPVIYIDAHLKMFVLSCTAPDHVKIAYLIGYGWLYLVYNTRVIWVWNFKRPEWFGMEFQTYQSNLSWNFKHTRVIWVGISNILSGWEIQRVTIQ